MSHHIADWDGPLTAFEIRDSVASIDTLILFSWKPLPAGVLRSLANEYGRRLILRIYPVRRSSLDRRGMFVTIHQPTEATLATLSAFKQRFSVHAVHIAVDFICPDRRQAELATAFLTRGVVQKWRRRGQKTQSVVTTQYWSRNRRKPRNIALYGDRMSKVDQRACAHLELRFTGAAACTRAGVADLASIAAKSPMKLIQHQTKIAFVDLKRLDRALEAKSRRLLRNSRRRTMTVRAIKDHLQRLLPRCLQEEGFPLDATTMEKARSQSLRDHRPELRACLNELDWKRFAPPIRWHRW